MNSGAYSIDEFCKRYGIGRTTVYAEIKDKRLKVRKVRRRTIITAEAVDDWLRALPEAGEEASA
jgi:excisionase family DNA binding protein